MQFSGIFSQILGSSHPHLESKLCPPDQNPGSAPAVYLCPQMCEKSQQTQKQKSLKQKRLSVISHRTLPRSLPFQVSWNHPGILPCVRFKTKSKSICFHRRSWKKGPTCVLSWAKCYLSENPATILGSDSCRHSNTVSETNKTVFRMQCQCTRWELATELLMLNRPAQRRVVNDAFLKAAPIVLIIKTRAQIRSSMNRLL